MSELVNQFGLEVVSGEQGLKRAITVDDLYRPGLEMAGYLNTIRRSGCRFGEDGIGLLRNASGERTEGTDGTIVQQR
ncbi:hypothetical protein HMSSN036_19890 [Paenibacillus macerans]|nr:hypothetical protein HMSSN036_19890 [Paenibacillus macerans]